MIKCVWICLIELKSKHVDLWCFQSSSAVFMIVSFFIVLLSILMKVTNHRDGVIASAETAPVLQQPKRWAASVLSTSSLGAFMVSVSSSAQSGSKCTDKSVSLFSSMCKRTFSAAGNPKASPQVRRKRRPKKRFDLWRLISPVRRAAPCSVSAEQRATRFYGFLQLWKPWRASNMWLFQREETNTHSGMCINSWMNLTRGKQNQVWCKPGVLAYRCCRQEAERWWRSPAGAALLHDLSSVEARQLAEPIIAVDDRPLHDLGVSQQEAGLCGHKTRTPLMSHLWTQAVKFWMGVWL